MGRLQIADLGSRKFIAIVKKGLLILVLLCVAIFFCWIAFVVFGKQKRFKFERIVKQPSLERFAKDFRAEINSTKVFAERYVTSYLQFVDKKIYPGLRRSFVLASKKSISAKAIFSSVAESFIYLYPADESNLIVECTEYPVQWSIFAGLDTASPSVKLTLPYEKALLSYKEDMKVPYGLREDARANFSNLTVSTSNPKAFSFSKNSLVVLFKMSFLLRDANGKETRKTIIQDVGLLTGNSDFSFALGEASQLGRELAQSETIQLIVSSPFFREALAYEELKPLAEHIQSKLSRAGKDPSFDYPFPLFKKDLATLETRAAKLGLNTDFVKKLLGDPSVRAYDGYLFWYYRNHTGFMLQWTLANVLLILVSVGLLALKRLRAPSKWKLVKWFNKRWLKSSLVVSANGYIFLYQKPEYLHFKYILIPGLLFLACLVLCLYGRSENNGVSK